jgi:hypothetical protein
MIDDDQHYTKRAQQELDLAASTTDPALKTHHLDMAGRYATLRERLSAPHNR